ncbi:NUDIX domain-containing protein [Cytobacillus gottheilii]|uniref:NUDIX domain-containing protein n=1 Tax=Cytobacillus gottheilii TaxID=859144 RepID=UPI0009BAB5D5|nr:NUDIX domain-containing protein [Cytobacillus gottheilii]
MSYTKNNGFEFLEFLDINEAEVSEYPRLAGSYAVVKSNNKYLLCYNTFRKQWEFPAGKRENGETPKECAIRELYEETGQIVDDLEFRGLLKVKNNTSNEIKYNPVYFTVLENLQPFRENVETDAITLWDGQQKIKCIDEVDLKLVAFIE